jgi:peptide/nickel transport system substrate-binding protein
MKNNIIVVVLSLMIALSLVLTSCAEQATPTPIATTPAPTTTAPKPTVTTPAPTTTATTPTSTATQAKWWDKFGEPEYGGTLTIRFTSLPSSFDPYGNFVALAWIMYESLFNHDWTLDRDTFNFTYRWTPPEVCVGTLVKSWEWVDSQTCIVKIREGVHWQDKPPTNGREFTAYDVEYHYDRLLGTGHGYTEPSPQLRGFTMAFEKITATDKYTAEFKFKEPSFIVNLFNIFDAINQNIEAPEMVEQNLFQDWRNVATTGPWLLTDYVSGVSMTLSRNPNYWAYDERHPQNRLPYADTLRVLNIPDLATALAAHRTGKVDILDGVSWEQTKSLGRTNPELMNKPRAQQAVDLQLRSDHAPFTDIRVRKALEIAIDRKTIAKNYYGGTVDGKPVGMFLPEYTGWCLPYDEWPQELKDEYSYNPTKAKQLLTEAGYPSGFHTTIVAPADSDLQLLQAIQSYLKDIGIDMDVQVVDRPTAQALAASLSIDQILYHQRAAGQSPAIAMQGIRTDSRSILGQHGDTNYDAMVDKIYATNDLEEIKSLARELDMYFLRQHWGIVVCPYYLYTIWQPYVNGYSGEWIRWGSEGFYYARIWVNSSLKKSMGR